MDIRKIKLLQTLPEERLQRYIDEGKIKTKHYSANTTVYNEKDVCETFDIVLSGSLIAYSLTENGSAMTLFEFLKGHTFGASLLFSDDKRYAFSIYCKDKAEILHLTKEVVEDLLHDYDFTLRFVRIVAQNARKMNEKMTMAMHRTLRENLMDYLRQQAIYQDSKTIRLPMTKKQLADHLGVQRPSLFRELKKMREEGLIRVDNRVVEILFE